MSDISDTIAEGDHIFTDDVIQILGISPSLLSHIYVEQHPIVTIHQHNALKLIDRLKSEVSDEHKEKTGKPIDFRRLEDNLKTTQGRFYEDPKFKKALESLAINFSDHTLIDLPWWNEITAGENIQDTFPLYLLPKHSYAVQISRGGIPREPTNISLAGIVKTSDDKFVFSLRNEEEDYFPNTYHPLLCSINLSDKLKHNQVTIYDVFLTNALLPKSGLKSSDLKDSEVQVLAKLDDRLHNGSVYLFLISTELKSSEVESRWSYNDKKELLFLEHNEIQKFIKTYYHGKVINDPKRPHKQRRLLTVGALALAAISGMHTQELQKLYKPGNH